jgi:hypothetical protein
MVKLCLLTADRRQHATDNDGIVPMSACVNARRVCVRMFPRAPVLNPSAVMEISSGASTTATMSYSPSVQNTSFTSLRTFSPCLLRRAAQTTHFSTLGVHVRPGRSAAKASPRPIQSASRQPKTPAKSHSLIRRPHPHNQFPSGPKKNPGWGTAGAHSRRRKVAQNTKE